MIKSSDLMYDEPVLVSYMDNGQKKVARITKRVDTDPESPREWDGNLGQMVCWHKRYTLGDEHSYENAEEFLRSLLYDVISGKPYFGQPVFDFVESGKTSTVKFDTEDEEHPGRMVAFGRDDKDSDWEYINDIAWPPSHASEKSWLATQAADWLTFGEVKAILDSLPQVYILPLYLIDHSGLSMSVNSFNDPWDSGQVGYVYALSSRAKELWCQEWDEADAAWKERAKAEMTAEIETYDTYLRGDVCGVEIEVYVGPMSELGEDSSDFDNEDSCWGFFDDEGADDFIEGVVGSDAEILSDDDIEALVEEGVAAEKAEKESNIQKAEQVLMDAFGATASEAKAALQSIGHVLMGEELYPEKN